MFGQLDLVACQSRAHRDRFVALGVEPQSVLVAGSVKYDATLPTDFGDTVTKLRDRFAMRVDDPVWIAASTHPGEDEVVLTAYEQLRTQMPNLRLVLVPRHPVRCDDVEKLARAIPGVSVARQSLEDARDGSANIVIGDVMGSLQYLYGLGQVAFVAGSMVDVGGHNPIEPALCRLPIVSGPYQFNFTEVMDTLAARGALVTVTNANDMAKVLGDWLENPELRKAAGGSAAAVVDENRGAQDRVLSLVRARIAGAIAQ